MATNPQSTSAGSTSAVRVPAAQAPPAAARGRPLGRGRRIAVWALVVSASVIALVSILTVWVDRQILDDNSWKHTTQQVVNDQTVRAALANRLVDRLYTEVDVPAALEQRLPANFKGLAAPMASALHGRAVTAAEELMARPKVQQLIVDASVVAHEKLLNVLENKTGYGISTGNGVVTLDLTVLIQQIAADIGLPGKLVAKLPQDAGVITLMKSDQLSAAQTGVRAVRVLSAWLLVAVLAAYGFAIYLARGERRRWVARVGWSFVIVGMLVLLVRRWLGNYVMDAVASAEQRTPVHHLWLIGTSILGETGRAVVLYGLIAVVGATLAGGSSLAVRLRRRLAPAAVAHPGVLWGSTGFLYLLLVLWGGTHALRTWWGILLLGGLLALGVAALQRQLVDEESLGRLQPVAVSGNGGPPRSAAEELDRLDELHRSGSISDDEFDRAKTLALR